MGRANIRSKAARATSSTASSSASALSSAHTKKSKLAAKHASFVSRIEKKAPSSSSKRSRRRAKAVPTLVAGLESLADALPDDPVNDSVNFTSGSSRLDGGGAGIGRKSIKSRPGAMKRKDRIVKSECERFGKNLAIMSVLPATAGEGGSGSAGEAKGGGATAAERPKVGGTWAALRGFISQTMEVKEEFAKKPAVGEMEIEA